MLVPLALFMALMLATSLQGLAVSGHFPSRPDTPLRGRIVLSAAIIVVIVCLVAGIVAASWLVPWYAAVIGGGLSLLTAPLILQWFPDRFVDGRSAVAVLTGISAALAVVLVWIGTGIR